MTANRRRLMTLTLRRPPAAATRVAIDTERSVAAADNPAPTSLSLVRQAGTDCRGASALLLAVTASVALGAIGIGTDVASWYMSQRSMQNAADAAVIAAASNGGSTYASEAKAVAARYGFADGQNNVTVTATNTALCPTGGNTCYSTVITGSAPLFFSLMVGYSGTNGTGRAGLSASAMAAGAPQYCMLALSTSGDALSSNGGGHANLQGCDVMSNAGARCNGHDLNAPVINAHGTNRDCGNIQNSNVPIVTDPYASLAKNIPANSCGSYPQESGHGNNLPSSNTWTGSKTLPAGNTIICGDLKLTGNVTLTATNSVLVIENGLLDLNSYTLKATGGLTIVFSGTAGSYSHYPANSGTLDFAAPTSGPWSGVAIYQDPALTTGVDISAAGHSPTWDITGLVYAPHSNVTLNGAVNKSSDGFSCFTLVANTVAVSGTGDILEHGQCVQAGLTMPSGRTQLVN